MKVIRFALLLAAVLCFLLAALGRTAAGRDLVAVGLCFGFAAFLVSAAQALD